MKKFYTPSVKGVAVLLMSLLFSKVQAQVIISQYYEGASGTNSWIELTNLGNTSVNTASPQLKLGIWLSSGSTGNIRFNGSATSTYNLNVVIPAKGSVLIGNSNNGTEVPYLSASSANALSNTVINFNGNDGIALLSSSNNVIDRFGTGINAANTSYVRNTNVTASNATFTTAEWTNAGLTAVQTAAAGTAQRLGYHLAPACTAPAAQPTGLVFSGITYNSLNGNFSASAANGYMLVRSLNSSLTANPADGTSYAVGASLGGGIVISNGVSTSFSSTSLASNTRYYYFVFAYNNTACSGGPKYLAANPLSGSAITLLAPCTVPAAQPSSLIFNTVSHNSANGSFTGSGANGYLVVQSSISSLSALPADGVLYSAGNTLGAGTVIGNGSATSFSASALNPNSNYYYFVFAYNNNNCNGGPKYLTANPLTGAVLTLQAPCTIPVSQPTGLHFDFTGTNSLDASFSPSLADGFLVLQSIEATLSAMPSNGTVYPLAAVLGNAKVLSNDTAALFHAASLTSGTTYHYYIFAYNNSNCSGGPVYLTANPLYAEQTTLAVPCAAPASQPTSLLFTGVTSSSISGNFSASGADAYLILQSADSVLTALPSDSSVYFPGGQIGNAMVISSSAAVTFTSTGLTAGSNYYYFVFSYNFNYCTGGPKYLLSTPLSGFKTTDAEGYNYYFGNLHSHSSYSDGNADNIAKIPADDYEFAKTAMCMDFLGISEHNHSTAGMHLADWQPLMNQAGAASTANFVALYGQEWGVIGTTGAAGDHAGHLLVYGVDSLIGWEPGNYQVFVPKSTYTGSTGLFDVVNRNSSNNAFVTLAHPDNYDYDDLLHINYDLFADNAIVGTAVENGPAFSTDTTYSNPPASMSTLTYYRSMLAKGYHLGPTIDHDNHNLTFGHTAKSRLAILASSLSKQNIFDAMRSMRFYATEDCNAKINFTVNNSPMGSIITKAGAPQIFVSCITTSAVSSIKIMYGVPGSGTAAVTLTSNTSAGSLSYTHTALANLSTGYYYADITETTGQRIITSPVWYTRDDNALRPAFITSLFTVNEADRVLLKWTARNEPAGEVYEVQRSADGRNFETIADDIPGRNLSSYVVADRNPVNGLAWYRLVHKNVSGKYASDPKAVNRVPARAEYLSAYPNPVRTELTISIGSAQNDRTLLEIIDMSGRRIKVLPVALAAGEQTIKTSVANLAKGTYILKLRLGNTVHTQMFTKL